MTAATPPLPSFAELALIEPLQRALVAEHYAQPTPIQAQAIPLLLAGHDVLGCAQTGTGKTAAFALPILQHLVTRPPPPGRPLPRVLVLTPTRELAAQIGESFASYGRFLRVRHTVMFGGVGESPQIAAVRRGVEVLVATPGRLLDLHGRRFVDLRGVEFFVLDEADRMLDMGFIHDVKRIIRELPTPRQNLLFSATLPGSITELASSFLHAPVRVEVTPPSSTVSKIAQSVMFVDKANKPPLLAALLRTGDVGRALIFTRTKHGADKLARQLSKYGIEAGAIHGNKAQNARTRALDAFKSGHVPTLIATDIASRGIDVDDVTHVFNYDLPNVPDSYVHRIGRTARAEKGGIAISLCDVTEGEYLRDIERTIGLTLPVVTDHPYHCAAAVPPPGRAHGHGPSRGHAPQQGRGRGGGHGGPGRGGHRGGYAPSASRGHAPSAPAGSSPAPAAPSSPPVSGGWRSPSIHRRRRR